jgi:AraC family transcriptional activator of pobA
MTKFPIYGISSFHEKQKPDFFYANELSAHLASHLFINTPHKHSTYIAVLFTKGKGKHQIDYTTYDVKPGSVFLLSPGQVHCWRLSKDAEGYVFFHTKEFYDRIFINRKINDFPFFFLDANEPIIYCSKKEVEMIAPIFKEIYDEHTAQLPLVTSKLGTLVDLLYINLSRYYLNNQDIQRVNLTGYLKVQKLQRLIDEHFKTEKLPKHYAHRMHMTTRHLGRLCQEILHKTTTQLIAERLIIEAKRMLTHSDLSMAEVSDQLGFDDYSYFIRFFKKQVGQSPRQFQQAEVTWHE